MKKFSYALLAVATATAMSTAAIVPASAATSSSEKKVTVNGNEFPCTLVTDDQSDYEMLKELSAGRKYFEDDYKNADDEEKKKLAKQYQVDARILSSCGQLSSATAVTLSSPAASSAGSNTTTLIAVLAVVAVLGAGAVASNPALAAQLNLPLPQ
ncbi:hypothetical protein ACFPVT_03325 [Corynebacterium choanae]|uniref:Secreted protein n=1 Tax=Corynebacterium choanae TaxID=1862358 RepID=A0A3G6JA75_9CORY|nr:hypothetical protein [Corynebacterium choanae]AZA14693.1 hypothetical protein CCHOA_11610 [Corynebacterium choanae]